MSKKRMDSIDRNVYLTGTAIFLGGCLFVAIMRSSSWSEVASNFMIQAGATILIVGIVFGSMLLAGHLKMKKEERESRSKPKSK